MEIKHLFYAVPVGALGGGAVVGSWAAVNPILADALLIVGVIMIVVAIVLLWAWVADFKVYLDGLRVQNDPQVVKMREAKQMTAQQIDFCIGAQRIAIDVELRAGIGVERFIRQTDIPLWFARYMLKRSYNETVYSIHHFSEGSHQRRWAIQFTAILCDRGFALPYAGGNKSARWASGVTPELILAALKQDNDDDEPPPSPGEMSPEGAEDARNRTHTDYYAKESEQA